MYIIIYIIYIHLSLTLSQLYINHADIETCVDGADRGKPWWHQGASGKRYLVGRFRFLGACKSPQHAVRTRLEFQVCGFGINLWKRCGSKIWDLLKLHWLVCAHGLESNFWTCWSCGVWLGLVRVVKCGLSGTVPLCWPVVAAVKRCVLREHLETVLAERKRPSDRSASKCEMQVLQD